MRTTEEAFRKFKNRLELNDREQADAGRRHKDVRTFICGAFDVDDDFLTGSYRRWTKTKPLKDIDILFVLGGDEAGYREKHPSAVIDAFFKALAKEYGEGALTRQARSVNIDFGIRPDAEDKTGYQVLSIDAVPAFASGDDYEIPDTDAGTWIKTNPKVHADKATAAHQAYASEWKGLVRMTKYWNSNARHGEKPVKPSFLLEVMALECIHGTWGGRFDYEVQALFSTLADRIGETWADPAGLGPPISAGMDAARKARARELLLAASRDATAAINLARCGRNGEALRAWRNLFGPRFPLS